MKKRILFGLMSLSIIALLAINIDLSISKENHSMINLRASTVTNTAQAESSCSHGRPLMRSGNSYYCDNCTGTDCGAVCK
jgi:hypothetical protein